MARDEACKERMKSHVCYIRDFLAESSI